MMDTCFVKIKDKDNTTLLEGNALINKPLSSITDEEMIGVVRFNFYSIPNNAVKIKVYGVNPSVGDIIFEREILLDEPVSSGIKYDKDKPLAGDVLQVFGKAIMGVGKCILKGAEKYPAIDNWKRVENAEQRYTNALVRHLIKHLIGEEIDKESGLPHLQHVAWNALAICELYLERKANDK